MILPMAVRLGKYYTYISYVPKYFYSVRKCFPPAKYILGVPLNIYKSAQIFICLRGYSRAFVQPFWLARRYLVYPQTFIHCPQKIICCA